MSRKGGFGPKEARSIIVANFEGSLRDLEPELRKCIRSLTTGFVVSVTCTTHDHQSLMICLKKVNDAASNNGMNPRKGILVPMKWCINYTNGKHVATREFVPNPESVQLKVNASTA